MVDCCRLLAHRVCVRACVRVRARACVLQVNCILSPGVSEQLDMTLYAGVCAWLRAEREGKRRERERERR